MIGNMVLQGVGGGIGCEHPTSVVYASGAQDGTLTLEGITKEPFCVMWCYKNGSTRYSAIYLKNPSNDNTEIALSMFRSSNGNWSKSTIYDATYNAETQVVTVTMQNNFTPFNITANATYCLYA